MKACATMRPTTSRAYRSRNEPNVESWPSRWVLRLDVLVSQHHAAAAAAVAEDLRLMHEAAPLSVTADRAAAYACGSPTRPEPSALQWYALY